MVNRVIAACTAGLLLLAGAAWPAWAEDSPIRFVSGPLAGARAENPKHTEERASEGSGVVRTDRATFSTRELFAYVEWSRLPGGYFWRASDRIGSLSRWLQEALKAPGVTVVRGDRLTLHGYLVQYRFLTLDGTGEQCAVFDAQRSNQLIEGAVCTSGRGEVPLMAVLEGLSVDTVFGP